MSFEKHTNSEEFKVLSPSEHEEIERNRERKANFIHLNQVEEKESEEPLDKTE